MVIMSTRAALSSSRLCLSAACVVDMCHRTSYSVHRFSENPSEPRRGPVTPSSLWPDMHTNALHYCCPGPIDHWITLLYNILLGETAVRVEIATQRLFFQGGGDWIFLTALLYLHQYGWGQLILIWLHGRRGSGSLATSHM